MEPFTPLALAGTLNELPQLSRLPSPVMVHAVGRWLVKVMVVEPALAVPPAHKSIVGLAVIALCSLWALCFVIFALLKMFNANWAHLRLYATDFRFWPGKTTFQANGLLLLALHQRLIARIAVKVVEIRRFAHSSK